VPVTETLHSVADIAELAESLKPCLQDSGDISRNPSTLFSRRLFSINFDMVPDSIGLYKKLNLKYEPLTLIKPNFETPMLGLQPATFPPILTDLPPPKLELYDLDDEFTDQKYACLTQGQDREPHEQVIQQRTRPLRQRSCSRPRSDQRDQHQRLSSDHQLHAEEDRTIISPRSSSGRTTSRYELMAKTCSMTSLREEESYSRSIHTIIEVTKV